VNTANLALWNLSWTFHTPVAVAASALSLAAVVAMVSLVYTEHRYSDTPSMLLSIYLTISILLDIALVRSLFLRGGPLLAIAALTSTALAIKILLIVLEEAPKERSSGLWNRTIFWWLNTTFKKGFRSFLAIDDLSALDHYLDSTRLTSNLEQKWNTGMSHHSENKCYAR
jgi:ATP-binding cassette subfamily C (CFTR/MRP) protein 1